MINNIKIKYGFDKTFSWCKEWKNTRSNGWNYQRKTRTYYYSRRNQYLTKNINWLNSAKNRFFLFFLIIFFPFKFFYSNTIIINSNNMKNNYMNQLLKYTHTHTHTRTQYIYTYNKEEKEKKIIIIKRRHYHPPSPRKRRTPTTPLTGIPTATVKE